MSRPQLVVGYRQRILIARIAGRGSDQILRRTVDDGADPCARGPGMNVGRPDQSEVADLDAAANQQQVERLDIAVLKRLMCGVSYRVRLVEIINPARRVGQVIEQS